MTRCRCSLAGLLAVAALVLLAFGCAGGRRSSANAVPGSAPPAVTAGGPADTLRGLSPEVVAGLEASAPKLLEEGVLFTFVSRRARSVAVAGTFNGWVPNAHPLVRRQPARAAPPAAGAGGVASAPVDSLWYALVPVPRGRHSYKYLVDGNRWLADPHNARQTGDGVGGVASVLVVP